MTKFMIRVNDQTLYYSDLASLVKALFSEIVPDTDYVGEYESVKLVIDQAINFVNYIGIVLGFNNTFNYPVDLIRPCHILEEIYRLYKTGLSRAWWIINSSILASLPLNIEELYDVMYEFIDYREQRRTSKLKPIFTWDYIEELTKYYSNAYDEYVELLKPITNESIDKLVGFMKKCHERFYEKHWEKVSKWLTQYCEIASKFIALTKPYDLLVKLIGYKPSFDEIIAYPVDVFRSGGGIYGAFPNRVVIPSDYTSVPTSYLAIVHEAGHLAVHDWALKLGDKVVTACKKMGLEPSIYLVNILEEISMALLQGLADEEVLGYPRITHGYMNTSLYKKLYQVYKELKREGAINYYTVMEKFLEEISKDKKCVEELKKLVEVVKNTL